MPAVDLWSHPGDLVLAARRGENGAWSALIQRYQPLLRSIISRYRLSASDAADVSQTVWLRVFDHLNHLREPAALPGWIGSITARACLETLRAAHRTVPYDLEGRPDSDPHALTADADPVDQRLLQHERQQAVRQALTELTAFQRELLQLLMSDPPVSYQEISARLGVPMGSIGPYRARCLIKLRNSRPICALADDNRRVDPATTVLAA